MPVPGDVVMVQVLQDGHAVVDRLEPRAFTLQRRTVGRSKTMAANVDMLMTVTALADPAPRLTILDQLLAFAELEEIAAAVVFTKPDLVSQQCRTTLPAIYRGLGYAALVVNPKSGMNVESLRELLTGRHALLCGVSGVGKSSIFRALGGDAAVGELSRHGLGRQTTTTARLYRLGEGFLVDSPGVNEFGLGSIQAAELAWAFREMREPSVRCRFTDCTHVGEPGCAVRAAVDDGSIAASRYASYTRILVEGAK